MRSCVFFLIVFFSVSSFGEDIQRIAFGSCSHQDKPQPIWSEVLAADPDLFIFLGDNIYGDSEDAQVLAAKYQKLAAVPGIQRLRESTEIIAIWDDHDYGQNDSGAAASGFSSNARVYLV